MKNSLIGLIIAAVVLPLVVFFGNLSSETAEGADAAAMASEHAELEEKANRAEAEVNPAPPVSPEVYLGYAFARVNLGNEQGFVPEEVVAYAAPESYTSLSPNIPYVEGEWKNNPDSLELVSDEGRILLKYTAKDVNIVAGQGIIPSVVYVSLGGKPANSTNKGSDVAIARAEAGGAAAVIDVQRLYNIANDDSYSTGVLELAVTGKGFRIYAFTFG